MRWCIIVSEAPFMTEFLGKVAAALVKQGDECVLVYNSKYAEYAKARLFPASCRGISKVDWLLEHYDSSRQNYHGFTWRPLYGNFDRVARWPWGYEQSRRRVAQEYQFFEWMFAKEAPDAILYEPPAGVMALVAHYLSLRFGIPYLGIAGTRISGRLGVHDTEYTDTRYRKTFQKLRAKDVSRQEAKFADGFVSDFLSHKLIPSYEGVMRVRFTPFEYLAHYLKRLKEVGGPLLRYIKERKKFRCVDFESEHRLAVSLRAPFDLALFQVRMVLQKGLYQKSNPKDQFYLFPLHLQPEASTSVQAMHYSNQAETIRQIAFQLPFPLKLYVKENATAIGTKPNLFYRELQNIPNVVLIDAHESTPELVRRCKGVITLTGTVGLEAVLRGKPAYALGKVFYEYHPLCRTPRNFDELREQILLDHTKGVHIDNLQEQNRRFVVSYLRCTFPGVVSAARAKKDGNRYLAIASGLRKVAQEWKRSMKRYE